MPLTSDRKLAIVVALLLLGYLLFTFLPMLWSGDALQVDPSRWR